MAEHINKDQIIEAVLNTAFYKSVGATSLTDIANALNIKKASLYNHFSNRDDIIESTVASCQEYYQAITFIPANYQEVCKKYSPETVLKGIVNRYFKMHEKSPLFQIYTYVHSQKYFNHSCAKIVEDERTKIINQTLQVLLALGENGKCVLTKSNALCAATWFCSGVNDMLNIYLLKRKDIIVKNPASGKGELFQLEADEETLQKIDAFVDNFTMFIK